MGGGGPSPEDLEAQERRRQELEDQADQKALAREQRRVNMYSDTIRQQRERDLLSGRKRGDQVFGSGSLGRVDAGRSGEMSDIIARRRAASDGSGRSADSGRIIQMRKDNLGGYTAEEQNALRENNLRTIQQGNAGAMRALASQQAAAGVRGPAAVAQRSNLIKAQGQQIADAERSLFVDQIGQKRAALDKLEASTSAAENSEFTRNQAANDALEKSITGARADELARTQYNQGQAGKEKYGALTTELGYASLGAGERAGIMQRLLGQDQLEAANAQANSGGGGKK